MHSGFNWSSNAFTCTDCTITQGQSAMLCFAACGKLLHQAHTCTDCKTAHVHVGHGKLLWQQWPSNLPHRGGLSNLPLRGGLCRYVQVISLDILPTQEQLHWQWALEWATAPCLKITCKIATACGWEPLRSWSRTVHTHKAPNRGAAWQMSPPPGRSDSVHQHTCVRACRYDLCCRSLSCSLSALILEQWPNYGHVKQALLNV